MGWLQRCKCIFVFLALFFQTPRMHPRDEVDDALTILIWRRWKIAWCCWRNCRADLFFQPSCFGILQTGMGSILCLLALWCDKNTSKTRAFSPTKSWTFEEDYKGYSLLAMESLPFFLKAFDKAQMIELKLLGGRALETYAHDNVAVFVSGQVSKGTPSHI